MSDRGGCRFLAGDMDGGTCVGAWSFLFSVSAPAVLFLGLTFLVMPISAEALDPPHDASNNISCDSCHAAHALGGEDVLPRGAEQEAMCKSCHKPTGTAAAMSEVANHEVGGGTIIDCGSCHDAHRRHTTVDPHPNGQTAVNLKLIRSDTRKYVGGNALEPAIFQERPGHYAFDEIDPPWSGICQTCHKQTRHHTNDGTGDHHHQMGLPCTACHPHAAGFAPVGGCSSCHEQPLGNRRQIVGAGGDFERVSHHVLGGVADTNCTVCHDLGAHPGGPVQLKDPDAGEGLIYTFNPADPAGVENFCLGCHDGDGAIAGGGVINEAISNGWFAGAYESFGDQVEAAFGLHFHHPVGDSSDGHLFDIGNGPEELECTSCHGVHQNTGKYWEAVAVKTPVDLFPTDELWGDQAEEKIASYDLLHLYRAPALGDSGTDLSGNPLPVDGQGNSLLTESVLPDYNTVCLACHEYAVGSLMAINWNDKKHGSAEAEPEGPAGWPLGLPFDTAQRGQYFLGCLDCHEAHGSENGWLIKRSVNGAVVQSLLTDVSVVEWIQLCDQCHSSSVADRHHNDDVWYNKLGMTGVECTRCHPHGSYISCISSGCHNHADFF